jgi:hypothetical protein
MFRPERCPCTYESGSRVRLGELDSGARLGYISPHTDEFDSMENNTSTQYKPYKATFNKHMNSVPTVFPPCQILMLVCCYLMHVSTASYPLSYVTDFYCTFSLILSRRGCSPKIRRNFYFSLHYSNSGKRKPGQLHLRSCGTLGTVRW